MFVLVDVQVLLSYVYWSCFSPVELEAVLPKVKDHVKLAVTFPSGSTVANSFSKVGISCQLEFNSIKPISMSDYIIIRDKTSNIRYSVTSIIRTPWFRASAGQYRISEIVRITEYCVI